MKKITILLVLVVSIYAFNCKEGDKTTVDETKTILEGIWVLDFGCQQDPTPNPIAWLIVSNNRDVVSCIQASNTVTKGLIIKGQPEGNYTIDWQQGPPSTAQYPVTQWNLLGLTSQGTTNCYSRVRNPANNPPAFCKY
ncbi:hypothetical protein EHQ12_08640 [Leptospira gomenensis]|uniref:Uncharacterized protein n=1 Tax=Leptospira gomenensis TaxID=2484974 RepID=A0A5F1Y5B9_9LEPT|nr:hypothetical protein [Leptospira gomenensis]TGK27556.1 hypothetical protein EHQ17_19500 [Leptospira gomenensis]TGK39881.1 hypothetical protein EHQ12_08640 [Leptospira gomenensis]TGK42637.1 hypothetical protein EHQ07_14600 [Leptospira gomenensis]TGK65800.1 hypothetical protein EHQ13_04705 [Leptospira gomenensis]